MKRHNKEAFSIQFLQLVDVVVVAGALALAVPVRDLLVPLLKLVPTMKVDAPGGIDVSNVSWLVFGMIPFVPLALERFRFYDHLRSTSASERYWQIIRALLLVAAGFAIVALVTKAPPQNRSYLATSAFLASVALLGRAAVVRSVLMRRQGDPNLKRRVVLVGSDRSIREWLEEINLEYKESFHVVGHFNCQTGKLDELESMLVDHAVERVFFLTRKSSFEKVSMAVELCEVMGVESCIHTNFIRARIASPSFENVLGVPMLVLRTTPTLSWAVFAKSLFDRVAAFLLIIVTFPLWVLAAIGIVLSDRGPVFFRQDRAGRYGKPFQMWKFRTMCTDAEQKLKELKESQGNQMSGPVFKLDYDPRIFPFGRWLRKTSIDELPQLLNVLMGEMSLVGPRPMACYELPDIEKSKHRRKLSVKPGITCIWQVEGRNTITDFDEWVDLDLKYIDNWSFWLDVKLLLKTVPAVLFSKGAK